MTTLLDKYLKLYGEIDRIADSGDLDAALRESGIALAEADTEWTRHRNSHENTPEYIESFALISSQHCELLLTSGYIRDSYATSVLSLLEISIDGHESARINRCILILYITAVSSMMQLTEQTSADDDSSREHASYILHYLASMLYFYYKKVLGESSGFDALNHAYQLLRQLEPLGVISDTLNVSGCEQPVPATSPQPILGDLIGRSHAMGWIAD